MLCGGPGVTVSLPAAVVADNVPVVKAGDTSVGNVRLVDGVWRQALTARRPQSGRGRRGGGKQYGRQQYSPPEHCDEGQHRQHRCRVRSHVRGSPAGVDNNVNFHELCIAAQWLLCGCHRN